MTGRDCPDSRQEERRQRLFGQSTSKVQIQAYGSNGRSETEKGYSNLVESLRKAAQGGEKFGLAIV